MVGGVVGHVLHKVDEAGLSCAKGKQPLQRLIGEPIDESGLHGFDFGPFGPDCGEIREQARLEESVAPGAQLVLNGDVELRDAPEREPDPLARKDVDECVAEGSEAASEVARELVGRQRRRSLDDPVVGPAVVFVEKLDVVGGHR